MRDIDQEQGTRVHRTCGSPGLCWSLVLLAIVAASGCANEENVRKSKGFYQEGVARLSSDQQQAYVSFQKAVKLNPDNKEAHYGLGHIYAAQGRLKPAEDSFREAIRIDGDYSEANTYLGQVLASQDRWKDAISAYRQALSNPLYPTPDLARFHLGKALMHEGDLQGAMEVLEDAA
ncbi:MAG: tetratricopeptide repeat protein, partial [Nitrospira sp. CR2.1]|nr:tetratricopeptide repeat protein [Nitrospira sp. CR2.1]